MKKLLFLFFIFYYTFHFAQDECGQAGGYTGLLKETYNTGAPKSKCDYSNGLKHGLCYIYYLDGTIKEKTNYGFGKLIETLIHPDPAHNSRDYRELHKLDNKNPTTYNGQSQYSSQRTKINDSTYIDKNFHNGIINAEFTYINGDQRIVKNYISGNLTTQYRYYKGKLNGTTVTLYSSGRINTTNNYKDNNPTGISKTYRDKEGTILLEEIIYSDDERTHTEDVYNLEIPMSIRKKYDLNGLLISYAVKYNRGEKIVILLYNRPEKHSWESCLNYYDTDTTKKRLVCEGEIINGEYMINNVYNKNGKRQIKNGNGKFEGNYIPLEDNLFYTYDTIQLPANCGTHVQWKMNAIEQPLPISGKFIYGRQDNNNSQYIPYYWIGRIKNGFLEGGWECHNESYKDMKSENYLHSNQANFKGNYSHSKKQGEWKLNTIYFEYTYTFRDNKKEGPVKIVSKNYQRPKTNQFMSESREGEEYDSDGLRTYMYYNVWLGRYKDNKMDGEWLAYHHYPDIIAFKALYKDGYLVAKTEEYNSKEKLFLKRKLNNGKVTATVFYSPENDELNEKDLIINYYTYEFTKTQNNKKHGKYLKWNNYTGEIYEKGNYNNNEKDGQWLTQNYASDTLIENYTKGILNGFYKSVNKYYKTQGNYVNNKKSGLWKSTKIDDNDTIYAEEVFMDEERYLLLYSKNGKSTIKNGEGYIVTESRFTDLISEDYLKSGITYKTIMRYKDTQSIESITYKTTHGDSLAYYVPQEGGTCIKNGTGLKTYFDSQKRILKIEHYLKGQLIKHDLFENGQYEKTDYYRFTSDTAYDPKTAKVPLFEKEITKKDDKSIVTIKIKNIPDDFSMLIYTENSLGSNCEVLHCDGFIKSDKSIFFTATKTINKKSSEIQYILPYSPETPIHSYSTLHWVVNKKHYEISPRFKRKN